jgi:hypothetical protein
LSSFIEENKTILKKTDFSIQKIKNMSKDDKNAHSQILLAEKQKFDGVTKELFPSASKDEKKAISKVKEAYTKKINKLLQSEGAILKEENEKKLKREKAKKNKNEEE